MVENLLLLPGDRECARARECESSNSAPQRATPPHGPMAQSQLNMSQITNTSDY